jgi:hypothetical protein
MYRHTCGAQTFGTALTVLLDERWASGKCLRCSDKDPWSIVRSEEEAKQAGMDAAAGVTIDWQYVARQWVIGLRPGSALISDDVTKAVGVPRSPGAVGALFRALALEGVIVLEGVTKSRRAGRHASMVREWRKV